jgi:anti-sigma regulatory factor (Ser/Thr protein kinase)
MGDTRYELVLPARVERLAELFDLVGVAGGELGLPDDRRGVIDLVVEEAFVNLCRHAYHGREDGMVGVLITGATGELVVELRDSGPAFNPIAEAPRPDLTLGVEARKPGGLGVELMRRMTDELRYQRTDGRNVLAMIFRW